MIALFASIATKLGVAERFSRTAGIAGAVILLALAIWGLKSCYDGRVIDQHEATQRAATAEADRKADNRAAEQRIEDARRLSVESQELQKATVNAETDRDRRLAHMRCIGLQQAARASGSVAPACS